MIIKEYTGFFDEGNKKKEKKMEPAKKTKSKAPKQKSDKKK